MVPSLGATEKIPSDTPGTIRLVAQFLNHYDTPDPSVNINDIKKQHVWDQFLSDDRILTQSIVHSVNSHSNYII
jgi:hypothetical protein